MATSLAHSQMADNKAKASIKVDTFEKLEVPKTPVAETVKSAVPYNVLFKLVKKKRGRTNLDNCCDNVTNPKTGKTERIWLFNGANSIWDTDLENILKDKSRYERARRGRDIIFIDGVLRVRSTDTLMLEFMRANVHNVKDQRSGAGKYDYYEYDPQQEQKERHAKQLMKIELVVKAKEMEITKVRKLCSFLNISFVDELGQPKSDDGLRTELMVLADSDPVRFQKCIDSKEVEVQFLVRKAIVDGTIDLGGTTGNATWASGKGYIGKVPANRKPLEYLTELAMTNSDEGRLFKEQLEQIVT